MVKILITGGSGFIGTNLLEYYLSKKIDAVSFDINPPHNPEHHSKWIPVDLLDFKDLQKKLIQFGPTHIVHLAARTDLKGPTLESYSVNTIGTENLIAASSGLATLEKIVFTSSMLVCKVGYIPCDYEDYNPTTIYGKSKMKMEQMIRKMQLNCQYNIIRPTSIWGPWFKTPYRDFFDTVQRKRYINIGKKACNKTYGFVLNSVQQIDRILFNKDINGKVFYIGDEPPLNISAWSDAIALKLGYTKPPQLPYGVFKLIALSGDLITKVGLNFPLTSFRLKNMTTDNVLPLNDLVAVAGPPQFATDEAIDITLQWLNYK